MTRTHITTSDPTRAPVALHGIYVILILACRGLCQRVARRHCFLVVVGTLGAVALPCVGREPGLVGREGCLHAPHVLSALSFHCRRLQPAAVQNKALGGTCLQQRSSKGRGARRAIASCVTHARSRAAPWRLASCTIVKVWPTGFDIMNSKVLSRDTNTLFLRKNFTIRSLLKKGP